MQEEYECTYKEWGQLGLVLQEARGADGKPAGVFVKELTDQLARDAGVRQGSKVLKINGEDIEFGAYQDTIKKLTEADFPKSLTLRGEKVQ